MKVLMVCLGNICRSPLAQGILESKVDDNYTVDSAGLQSMHAGELPDERSILEAKKHGIDLTNQRGRQIKAEDFDLFDIIFVMDKSNFEKVRALTDDEGQKAKVRMILNESYPNQNLEVDDPYYGNQKDFEKTYELLDKATDDFLLNQKKKGE